MSKTIETRWTHADQAASALQTYALETRGAGYGDEGSAEFEAVVVDFLTDLKHLLYRAGMGRYMLTEMTERAIDRWSDEAEVLPEGAPDE